MEFLLVGQPNCGKSTIFNYVVGYKSVASNFPGVTVKYTKGELEIGGRKITVTDLPGTYSLQTTDEAEAEAAKYLLRQPDENVIINITDASVLSRSLELTLQLLELNRPMIVVLNMTDEAEKKGIRIDEKKLSGVLGCPVVKTVGKKGIGVYEMFDAAVKQEKGELNVKIKYSALVEKCITLVSEQIETCFGDSPEAVINTRLTAIKLLEKDKYTGGKLKKIAEDEEASGNNETAKLKRKALKKAFESIEVMEKMLEEKSQYAISSARHSTALNIFEMCAKVGRPDKKDIREHIDDILMHPVFGYVSLVVILFLSFSFVFKVGNLLEPIFLNASENISIYFAGLLGESSVIYYILNGLVTGLGGGIGIIIPYLLPFFIVLSFLEDTGYLARIAYLTDNIMHRIGLHGLSIVPMIFGYGCTVPAIMATRILKSPRDKLITATLTTLVPCSARMTVIFGLIGFFVSIKAAILIYIINVIIIGVLGKFMAKVFPEVSPGLIMEIPKYHLPGIKPLLNKTWFRLKEFVTVALPLLVVGSIVLEVIEYFNLDTHINNFLSPFTNGLLGLPAAVGVTLLFGIMRKELALLLLFSALGTQNISEVMTTSQMLTFTTFVTFYLPCLATFAALAKELKTGKSIIITLATILLATILAVTVRVGFAIF